MFRAGPRFVVASLWPVSGIFQGGFRELSGRFQGVFVLFMCVCLSCFLHKCFPLVCVSSLCVPPSVFLKNTQNTQTHTCYVVLIMSFVIIKFYFPIV